jgi:cytochrome c oxidase cbb3-type subunit 4
MSIDLNLMRAGVTLLSFVAFIGIIWWVLARNSKADFDEAARLPFLDDAAAPAPSAGPLASPASLER